jgi:hypothetical protein
MLHGPVVGGQSAVRAFTVVMQAQLAGFAVAATVDHAAHADDVAHGMRRYASADLRHTTNHFVARHARVHGVRPIVLCLVDIGMADAAEKNLNLHVALAWLFPFEAKTRRGLCGSWAA